MTDKLKQTMNSEISKLPKEQQDSINSVDWGKESEEIGKKYSLDEAEINNLQLETGLVLIGLTELSEYKKTIEENIGISAMMAEKIYQDILAKIFKPILDKSLSFVKARINLNTVSWDKTVNFIVSGGDYSVF